ncbi:MAG: hypothetical protein WBQ68_15345 [Terriglobales bacterium]
MPNTGERREITARVNAKESEMVQESKKLVSRTRELSARSQAKSKSRLADSKKNLAGARLSKAK